MYPNKSAGNEVKIVNTLKRIYRGIFKLSTNLLNFAAKFSIPLTPNNYKILRLKNKYQGKRCFIIGNGPSLTPEDLEKLKNEFTFASNKVYKIFDKTTWRPTFYMAVDEIILNQNAEDMNAVQAGMKFTLNCYKHLFKADIYFNNNLHQNKLKTFSPNIMESLYSHGTVSYHMLQIAFYMGFSEVYLLGHDYNFKGAISKTTDLSFLKTNSSAPLYFCQDYIKADEKPAGQAPDEMYHGMEKAKLVYEKAGRKIYNASRISYLDVFEKINLDDVCKG